MITSLVNYSFDEYSTDVNGDALLKQKRLTMLSIFFFLYFKYYFAFIFPFLNLTLAV